MIEVIKKGLETSIQDYPGRIGSLNQGFPLSGPMDSLSLRLGNILVGNKPGDAALECQFLGPSLLFKDKRVIAITGADMTAKLDGKILPLWENIEVNQNQILELDYAINGARTYIAISGAINSEPWLNSRSTFHKAGIGGIEGRAIKEGQTIPLGKHKSVGFRKINNNFVPIFPSDKNWIIEVVRGPNDDWIDESGHEMFLNSNWKLQSKSDRTGYRLDGPDWTFTKRALNKSLDNGSFPSNIIDQAYPTGAINLAGQTPIILVNDGPSMGGFIVPYTVPSCAFWKLGQAKPGESFKFIEITVEEAQSLRREQNAICTDQSIENSEIKKNTKLKVKNNLLTDVYVKDFSKEKLKEKNVSQRIQKKGLDKIKIRYFN